MTRIREEVSIVYRANTVVADVVLAKTVVQMVITCDDPDIRHTAPAFDAGRS